MLCFLSVCKSKTDMRHLKPFRVESEDGERSRIELKDLYICVYCKTIVMRISDHFRERQKTMLLITRRISRLSTEK